MPMTAGDMERLRSRLGPTGVWLAGLRTAPVGEVRALATGVEALGYRSLWCGEALLGREVFTLQAILLASTTTLVTGTGIANIWARDAGAMQGAAWALGDAYPGRFVLGIGVSHARLVEQRGSRYERPVEHLRHYLAVMDDLAAEDRLTEPAVPRLLAALRPRMLELAREHADGAHPYLVPVRHTSLARGILGPDKLLMPEQAVVVDDDLEQARSVAHVHVERYLQLPNYVNNLRQLGYGDVDLDGGGSDRLVEDLVACGSAQVVAERIAAQREAGADHVLVHPLGAFEQALPQLEALAPLV